MMVFIAALLANGVARIRSADFMVDFATKSAIVFSPVTGVTIQGRWQDRGG